MSNEYVEPSVKGVFGDINDSNYSYSVYGYKFYFTSWKILNNFVRDYEYYVKHFNRKFNESYKSNINLDRIAVLIMYQDYEKRGFRIIYDGGEFSCLKDLRLTLI